MTTLHFKESGVIASNNITAITIGDGLLTIHADGSVTGTIDQAQEAARVFVEALRAELINLMENQDTPDSPNLTIEELRAQQQAYEQEAWFLRYEDELRARQQAYDRKVLAGARIIRDWESSGLASFRWRRAVVIGETTALPSTVTHAVLPSGKTVCHQIRMVEPTTSSSAPPDLPLCKTCCVRVAELGHDFLLSNKETS